MLRLAIVLSLITHIAACGKDDGTSRTYNGNPIDVRDHLRSGQRDVMPVESSAVMK